MRFRMKPVVIEAAKWTGDVTEALRLLFGDQEIVVKTSSPPLLVVPTTGGNILTAPGDWIIRGVKGELYPCKPDIFVATYEGADDADDDDLGYDGTIIGRLLKEAGVPGQEPAIACGVALRNGMQLEGSLSRAPEGNGRLRMLCPTPSGQVSGGAVPMLEFFFFVRDVMAVAVRRDVTVTKPSIIARG